MIPKLKCKDRVLYRISSRNLTLGVYHAEKGGFLGLRTKFGDTYVFEEFHWDNGPPYGTVKPDEELPELLPFDIELTAYLKGSVCQTCNQLCEYVRWPEGGERELTGKDGTGMKVSGQWQHVHSSLDCCGDDDVRPVCRVNHLLDRWLREMLEKYS